MQLYSFLFINKILMGVCCGNLFKVLMEKYGKEFVTLMVCENGKIVVNQEFTKVKKDFGTTFTGATNHVNSTVDSKNSQLTKIYESAKNKISVVPGALQALEKSQGKPLDDLSGFNKLKAEIATVKKDALTQMDSERTMIQGKMKTAQTDMITKINTQKPKIAEYDDLPGFAKKDIMKTADKQLATEFSQNRSSIVSTITGSFGPSTLSSAFGKFNPQTKLDSIVGGASGQFTSALGAGNPLGGAGKSIGGFL